MATIAILAILGVAGDNLSKIVMFLFFLMSIFCVLNVRCGVVRKPLMKIREVSKSDQSSGNDFLFWKIKELLHRLRKHQHDENVLKINIRAVLSLLRQSRANRNSEKVCRCHHQSIKEILDTLGLPPEQTEVLVQIVEMMKKDNCDNKKSEEEEKENDCCDNLQRSTQNRKIECKNFKNVLDDQFKGIINAFADIIKQKKPMKGSEHNVLIENSIPENKNFVVK